MGGKGMIEQKKPVVLKLVFFIVDWSKIKVISSIFDQVNVRFHFVVKGLGTANSAILDVLGIGSTEKAVIVCLEQDVLVPALLKDVGKKLGLNMPGTGIAFSAPLSGINAPILRVFKNSVEKSIATLGGGATGAFRLPLDKKTGGINGAFRLPLDEKTGGVNGAFHLPLDIGDKMNEQEQTNQEQPFMERRRNNDQPQCDLIMAILNQGYSDEFMTVAREAGAGGGTVINARGLMHKGPVKFFGISVQDEKEIVIILSTHAKMRPIMEAVSKAFGIASKAEGIVFSLPAENITGIDLRS
jgi:hypothetical protein